MTSWMLQAYPQICFEYDENKTSKLKQCLTEKWDHLISLYDPLLIILPVLAWSVARNFMLYIMIENKKGFTNIVISFLR